MKNILMVLQILFLLINCSMCNNKNPEVDETPFNFYCLEQKGRYGESTLYKYGDIEILVDFGTYEASNELYEMVKDKVTDHKIELLVSTHPHTDHFKGLDFGNLNTLVAAGVNKVDYIVDSGCEESMLNTSYYSTWVENTRNYYMFKGARYKSVQKMIENHHDDAIIEFNEDLSVQFFDTENYYTLGIEPENNISVAMVIRFKNYNIFTFGDLPKENESGLLKYERNILYNENSINILKASHHGSNGANSEALIATIKPTYCWASSAIVSENLTNKDLVEQHPYSRCSRKIVAITSQKNFYWTGTCGTINFTLSKDNVEIHGLGRKLANYYFEGSIVDPNEEKDLPFYKTKFGKSYAYR